MESIKQVLKNVDQAIKTARPETMDEIIDTVHSVNGMQNYGSHFKIVKKGENIHGVRVCIFGRFKEHILPSSLDSYPIFKGIEKYINSGYPVINI